MGALATIEVAVAELSRRMDRSTPGEFAPSDAERTRYGELH
jgi:hypothetical protein